MGFSFITILLMFPGAFFAPVIHEFTKARVSAALGDPTPKRHGFLTYNPFKFFEPIGFIFMLAFRGVGWGQPVPTSPLHYKDRRKGVLLTYTVPMFVNLLVGLLALGIWQLLLPLLASWASGLFVQGITWPTEVIGYLSITVFLFAHCLHLLLFQPDRYFSQTQVAILPVIPSLR